MHFTRHIGRFLGAVIVMIALFGTSSAAFAHVGHDHTAAVQANVSVDDPVSIEAAEIRVQKAAAKAAVPSDLPTKKRCMGGCCSSASGHACCGFNLPNDLNTDVPNGMAAAQGFVDPPFRDGLDPAALRKPPRTFA
jgi:hypothetical protein